jgi:hypothetical protein
VGKKQNQKKIKNFKIFQPLMAKNFNFLVRVFLPP